MEYTNASNLPQAILRAVTNDPYSSKGSNISATRLIAPPRIRVLEMRNWDLLKEDVSDKIFALLGQSVHHIIQRSKQRVDLSERRLFYKDDKITNGWTLSGSFDYLERDGRLIDYKVTSAWATLNALTNPKPEWENQLNVLDFLCRKNQKTLTSYSKPIKVRSLSIMAILRDWSKLQVLKSDTYPRKQVVMIPVRRWTPEEQDDYIKARIKLHQDSEKASKLPLCTAKERWRQEDVYALMLDGRKSAKRLLPTKEEMDQYLKANKLIEGKGCKVVFRKGEDIRCMHYCRVNEFCDYYMNFKF